MLIQTKHSDSLNIIDTLETHVNMDMITLKQVRIWNLCFMIYLNMYIYFISFFLQHQHQLLLRLQWWLQNCFLVYFVSLYFMNASLKYTTLGSSSILNSMLLFHFIPRNPLQNWKFHFDQRSGCCRYFAGVLINSLPGAKAHERNAAYGDILALSGAIFYAIF